MTNLSIEIVITIFSFIGVLVGYIWNDQAKRLQKIEDHCDNCPFYNLKSDIAEIKNDIIWLKKYITHNLK